jgi:hypothetical protein
MPTKSKPPKIVLAEIFYETSADKKASEYPTQLELNHAAQLESEAKLLLRDVKKLRSGSMRVFLFPPSAVVLPLESEFHQLSE